MRTILNLSMPAKTAELTKKRAIKRGFPSISSYIRFLIDEDGDEIISETELLKLSRQADEDCINGRLIKANSMADLL